MVNRIKQFLNYLYNHPIYIFLVLLVTEGITILIADIVSEGSTVHWALIILRVFVAAYFFISLKHILKLSLKRMLNPKNFVSLLGSYILFVATIIIVFSTTFSFISSTNLGHLTYGYCDGSFDINNPDQISRDYLYFSAITFFTVGYGDICPVGVARLVSVIAAFVGHVISVFLVALILNNYLETRKK